MLAEALHSVADTLNQVILPAIVTHQDQHLEHLC
jgi:divalent metal cation (Fe/Co/Zn/Cd) transporter